MMECRSNGIMGRGKAPEFLRDQVTKIFSIKLRKLQP
jgi:hypothetical protein